MLNKLKGLVVEEQGQGMTEYGLVLGIIAVAVIAALGFLREEIVDMFDNVLEEVRGREDGDATTQQ